MLAASLTACAAPPPSAYSGAPKLSDLNGQSVGVSAALAATPMDQTLAAKLEAIMQNPDQQAAAVAAIKQSVYWTSNPCPTATFTRLPGFAIFDVVRFNSQGQPIAGTWREGIFESGCGINQQLNVANYVTGPGEVHVTAMLPGTTIATAAMQAYLVNAAADAAGVAFSDCQIWYVADTDYIGPEGPVAADGSQGYKEDWTIDICGTRKRTILHFKVVRHAATQMKAYRNETTTLSQ